ncbi:MAG: hypothetical protein MR964_08670 [Campylobacter sp.]|uniref:hypothetical protein n=1 Tax=Campylobacter sp. TaxID=205 RepID=UPI002AA937A9|nr:hypothetical protein [Campylobacter sp.]MCI7024274.1 hypothetical protein [Campylobacter sp.]
MGILKLAVAAVKLGSKIFLLRTRWVAIFSFKAAALAVRGRQQLQKFCAEFSRRKPQKKECKSFCKVAGLRKALKLKSTTKRLRTNQRMRSKKN